MPYPTYFAGARFIHFLLGPAVVALAWPLWQRRDELRQRWGAGGGVCDDYRPGGRPRGHVFVAALRISTDRAGWAARGFAMGTAAHGLGAARALQVNADAGAYARLALGLQVVLASLLMPLAFRLF